MMPTPQRMLRGLLLIAAAACLGGLPAMAMPTTVQIGELDDLRLGSWRGQGEIVAEDTHCVGVRGGFRRPIFRLEAYGDGPRNAFALTGSHGQIDYTVYYDDGRGLRVFPAPGRMLGALVGSRIPGAYRRCLRGRPLQQNRIGIRIAGEELSTAAAGRYRGTLLLMVLPE